MHPFTRGWWRFAWSNWRDRTPSHTTVDLRNALAAFDRAHGVPPPPRASEG